MSTRNKVILLVLILILSGCDDPTKTPTPTTSPVETPIPSPLATPTIDPLTVQCAMDCREKQASEWTTDAEALSLDDSTRAEQCLTTCLIQAGERAHPED